MKQEMMRVAVASAGSYADHLHLAPDNQTSTSSNSSQSSLLNAGMLQLIGRNEKQLLK